MNFKGLALVLQTIDECLFCLPIDKKTLIYGAMENFDHNEANYQELEVVMTQIQAVSQSERK